MERFKAIAFTHRNVKIEEIGKFHIADDLQQDRLSKLKEVFNLDELMYLSTCNRVEFFMVTDQNANSAFLSAFFTAFNQNWGKDEVEHVVKNAQVYQGKDAVEHTFQVASSLDSLVIGEREIITQVRNSYEKCRQSGLTGDFLRLLIQRTVETAKEVFTKTDIARKSVSVVSLAYHKLKDINVPLDARILMIGAGQTSKSMAKFLKKHGYKNFTVFNRTLSRAEALADLVGGKALPLEELNSYNGGFDVIVSCTGSEEKIITKDLYKNLLGGESDKKVVIDLAVPGDFDEKIKQDHTLSLIAISNLKTIAERNLRERKKELTRCEAIIEEKLELFEQVYQERQVEIAMKDIPIQVKKIHQKAMDEVFAKDLENLDEHSLALLNKVLGYVEKKYISMPMQMAKKIMLNPPVKK